MTIRHIFFDLHGTLVDSARLSFGYADSLGRVIAGRSGGDPADWSNAYRRILADWDSYYADLDLDGDDGLADLWEGELRVTRALFRLTSTPQPDIRALTLLSRELPYLAARRCDVLYPDAKEVVQILHDAGFVLGIAAHAVSTQARVFWPTFAAPSSRLT